MPTEEVIKGIFGWALVFLQEDWWFFLIIMVLFSLTIKEMLWRIVDKKTIFSLIFLFAIGLILFFAIAGYKFNGDVYL